ncbi:MAG: UDP-N-acetylmuramoyl-L-alanyl-D-glutamate--2,6-diaminopimelate ligase [Gemmatimonadaceae bacterium]|nr:UDP-N-acetylmuramoyl-L-alanyl-D-glutamate--2,6-diaminopimelate ligase [Gemmatimonadaceae bacterium]
MTSAVHSGSVISALRNAGLLLRVAPDFPGAFADVADDSRRVTEGALFIAVRGHDRDGHDYLDAAVAGGATGAIVEREGFDRVPTLVVRDGRRAAGIAASVAFGEPGRRLRLAAVTGTNGKTTTVGMLRHLLDSGAGDAASIGTLGTLVGSVGERLAGGSGLTTPGPVELQRTLRALLDRGVRWVAMEVSSHSLDQRRIEGLRFAAAVFTNVTRDHLDYHGSMAAYIAAKGRLLDYLATDGWALLNADDPAWGTLVRPPLCASFGMVSSVCDVRARDVRPWSGGSRFVLETPAGAAEVSLPLIGDFNVMNALAAAAAAWALGIPVDLIGARLTTMPQIPGRLERILDRPVVLRDYAHTPDALARALAAVRPFVAERLIVVFGCGGDRDRGKRPEMGAIAESVADVVVVTSDNPRTEDPERIIDEIEAGMTSGRHLRIVDRREAIASALDVAREGDVVILAGKGHETYQVRGSESYPFDERSIVRELAGVVP